MLTQLLTTLPAANLTDAVLDNLQPGSPLQPKISATLNSALKTQLTATTAKPPALVGLINSMPAADLVAAKDLKLAFAQQQIDPIVAGDPAMRGGDRQRHQHLVRRPQQKARSNNRSATRRSAAHSRDAKY